VPTLRVPSDGPNSFIWGPRVDVERENPDGRKVTDPVLRGVLGLYIKQQGRTVEATDACREFIGYLDSLLAKVRAAV
jgi:hypothetical protein